MQIFAGKGPKAKRAWRLPLFKIVTRERDLGNWRVPRHSGAVGSVRRTGKILGGWWQWGGRSYPNISISCWWHLRRDQVISDIGSVVQSPPQRIAFVLMSRFLNAVLAGVSINLDGSYSMHYVYLLCVYLRLFGLQIARTRIKREFSRISKFFFKILKFSTNFSGVHSWCICVL
jgi:hypothetical protein